MIKLNFRIFHNIGNKILKLKFIDTFYCTKNLNRYLLVVMKMKKKMY